MKPIVRPLLSAFLAVLIAFAAGCKEAPKSDSLPPTTAPAAAAIWPATRKTDGGHFTVTIQPEGGTITRNQHFSIEVLVEPGTGAAAPSSVTVDADMPSHGHGMNTKPETTPEGGPRYRAKGMLFHMAGEWSIMVEVAADAARERAFFPVSIE